MRQTQKWKINEKTFEISKKHSIYLDKRKEETRLNMPVGVSGFEKLRERNYFYIDKTELIEQILFSYSKKTPTSKVGDELRLLPA